MGMRHGRYCNHLWINKTRYPQVTCGKRPLNKSQMGRKKTVAWSKLDPRVHWNHRNWTCGTATSQTNPQNAKRCSWVAGVSADPWINKILSCCSMGTQLRGGPWAASLPRRPGTAMGSRGCRRTDALQLNQGLLRPPSAWDHGGTRQQDLHRKTLLHKVFICSIWLFLWLPLDFTCFAFHRSITLRNAN